MMLQTVRAHCIREGDLVTVSPETSIGLTPLVFRKVVSVTQYSSNISFEVELESGDYDTPILVHANAVMLISSEWIR